MCSECLDTAICASSASGRLTTLQQMRWGFGLHHASAPLGAGVFRADEAPSRASKHARPGSGLLDSAQEYNPAVRSGPRHISLIAWQSADGQPILTISPQPQGQMMLSGSIIRSMRGKLCGRARALRFLRGTFFYGSVALAAIFSSTAAICAWVSAMAVSRSSSASSNCAGSSFSDFGPNLVRRQS